MTLPSPPVVSPRVLGAVQGHHVVSTVKKQKIIMDSSSDTDEEDLHYETAGEESETTWV